MLTASLLGWPAPLLPIQLLWNNLVTDGLPALALSLEKPEPQVMRRRPRAVSAPILPIRMGVAILLRGLLIGAAPAVAFAIVMRTSPGDLGKARTVTFCVLAFSQVLCAFAARSSTLLLWQLGPWSNPHIVGAAIISGLLQLSVVTIPFAQPVFETAAELRWEWALIASLSLAPVTLIELAKLRRSAWSASGASP